MNFNSLVLRIQETNDYLQQKAVKAVNTHITLRNWLTGFYIVEFEQNGSDRAEYGVRLLEKIAKNIAIRGLSAPELSRCRQFYAIYPQFFGLLTQEFKSMLPTRFLLENLDNSILGSVTQELQNEENDNPSVGILLVTNQNETLVEYAISDSDLDIFVSKYQLQLPDKSKLEAFINKELKNK